MSERCYDGSIAGPNDLRLPRTRFNELVAAEQRLRELEGRNPARRSRSSSAPRDAPPQTLTPDVVGHLLELGLGDGRIGLADADHWRRSFETSPAETTRRFAQLPTSPERAEANAMAAFDYASDTSGRFGIPVEEVV